MRLPWCDLGDTRTFPVQVGPRIVASTLLLTPLLTNARNIIDPIGGVADQSSCFSELLRRSLGTSSGSCDVGKVH